MASIMTEQTVLERLKDGAVDIALGLVRGATAVERNDLVRLGPAKDIRPRWAA